MGLFDFLKGGKSSKRSKGRSRKKASISSSEKPTRAEKSALNKKLWAEKQAQSSSNSSQSSKRSKAQQTTSSASDRRATKAERSAANKTAWAEKSAKERAERAAAKSSASKPSSIKKQHTNGEKPTRSERPALGKKIWATNPRNDREERATARSTNSTPSLKTTGKGEQPVANKVPKEKTLTRAEKSSINKEKYRRQREAEANAAKTGTGHRKRREAFASREDYEKYLNSETWKKTREGVKNRSGGRCERCGSGGSQVHHIRYSEPGQEHNSHMMYVCNACHREIHRTKR